MQRILPAFLVLSIFLASCGGAPPPDDNRQATFTLILNDVQARADANADLEPAALGDRLQVGGQAWSGADSRARLDLEPDGTIVRIGPDTLFTLEALEQDTASPFARLELLFGQIWIILAAGSLEVQTPYGLAAVRGSYMSVAFDETQGMVVTCLEGHCSLANEAGTVELTGGQVSSIPQAGEAPSPAAEMDEGQFLEWQEASPEAVQLLDPNEMNEPRYTDDGQPIPQEAEGPLNTRPFQFELTNNCPASSPNSGDWLWQFERLPDSNGDGFIEMVVVPTGQTVSGSLPPGQYIVTDWFADGQQHGPQITNSNKISLQVQNCPEGGNPTLPPSPPR